MQVFFMIDRHFVSSVLLGLVAGMLGTVAYVAGHRHLNRFRGRPLTFLTLDLVLTLGISVVLLGLILSVDTLLARVRASYNPQILVLSMFVPMGIARVIAERRARRDRRLLFRDLR
jgi:hypothetical protein